MKNVQASDSPSRSTTPTANGATLEFQRGFFHSRLRTLQRGAATVTLHLPDGQGANSYFKFGRFPSELPFLFPEHWYDFSFDPQTDTGAEFSGSRVVLHFVDGGRGCSMLPLGATVDTQRNMDLALLLFGFGRLTEMASLLVPLESVSCKGA